MARLSTHSIVTVRYLQPSGSCRFQYRQLAYESLQPLRIFVYPRGETMYLRTAAGNNVKFTGKIKHMRFCTAYNPQQVQTTAEVCPIKPVLHDGPRDLTVPSNPLEEPYRNSD